MNTANQCQKLGLAVGETIFGREEGPGGCWHEARLTLLWLGQQEAMWSVQERSDRRPDWSEPRESGDWTLECRNWQKVDAGVARMMQPCQCKAGTLGDCVANTCAKVQAGEWEVAERIRDLPEVDEALLNFKDDCTSDNATCIVREVLRAAREPAIPHDPSRTP